MIGFTENHTSSKDLKLKVMSAEIDPSYSSSANAELSKNVAFWIGHVVSQIIVKSTWQPFSVEGEKKKRRMQTSLIDFVETRLRARQYKATVK